MEAPMSSSVGAFGPLLRKLDSLLAPDSSRLSKLLRNRIEGLRSDLLEDIVNPLMGLTEKNAPDLPTKYWMTEVRELSYDIEDSLDEMIPRGHTDAGAMTGSASIYRRWRVGCAKIRRFPKTLRRRTRIAKVAQLRIDLVWEAIERHERYLEVETFSPSSTFVFTAQDPTRYGGTSVDLVDIDDKRIQLTNLLKKDTKQKMQVVSVVGCGGIGKTTLAMELYHELGGQFECRAFVQASRKTNIRRLLWGILSQIQRHQRPTRACTVQSLINNIRIHLKDKRYFIVIDDLYHTALWDIVVHALPEHNNCSKIITTTEMEDVARVCCDYHSDFIFNMKPLGDSDSVTLFKNIAIGTDDNECSRKREEVIYEITSRSGGLPLAITSVAGLARASATQPNKLETWLHIQNSISSSLKTSPSVEEMMKEIISLSYNSLPQHLKTCLLYLSIYPEGHTIWKADIVKQWIAEGFISGIQGKDKEVAESYFNELINMRLIHPKKIKCIDGVVSCTVHHMVLDLIKCKSKEENFTTVIDYPQIITGLSTKVRRLSLQLSSAKHATKQSNSTMSHVRSLAFFGLLDCLSSIAAFKLLRVLILEIWGDQDGCTSFDLTNICTLLQLRYLKITCDVTVELPDEMAALQHLETLEVDAKVSAVPLDIIHLPRLSQFRIRDEKKLPNGIRSIRSLHTLQYFDLAKNSEENIQSLGELTNLRDLHLTCSTAPSDGDLKRNIAALASSLGKLGNLNSLTLAPGASGAARIPLEGSSIISSVPDSLQRLELVPAICIFSRLPELIAEFRKLRVLKLYIRDLLRNDLDSVSRLPALIVLSLHIRVARIGTVIVKPTSFPVLRFFLFRCGTMCLAFRAGAMPNLQRLKLGFSAKRGKSYGRMIAGVEHLLNLQEITGQIATASGAGESDRRAAESAFRDAIEVSRQKWDATKEHPRFPRVHVRWADWVECGEAYAYQQVEGSGRGATTVNNMLGFPIELLPDVISFTSPLDACRCSAVCTAFQAAAIRDEVWDRFFPPDYLSIISRAIDPVDFDFACTKKELFVSLAEQPIIIDQGHTSFWLDRTNGAKSYMLASRSFNIAWGDTSQYWTWISLPSSRFEEVAELVAVCWLDIIATTDCRELSPNTRYAAYLVFNLAQKFYGLDCPTQQACITMAGAVPARHVVSLHPRTQETISGVRGRSRTQDSDEDGLGEQTIKYPGARRDGWMEVELGEFYNGNLDDGAVVIRLKEHTTLNWKRGLIIEGVEIRPKSGQGQ